MGAGTEVALAQLGEAPSISDLCGEEHEQLEKRVFPSSLSCSALASSALIR